MRKIYVIIALLCICFKTSYSHPHIFMDSSIEIICNDYGIYQIVVNWEFDEMFSQSLITDYDFNKDGSFNKEEIEELRKGAFVNLENYEYFTHLRINKEKHSVQTVENFNAYIYENKVSYTFSIPCSIKLTKKDTEFRISFYDTTYFCDIAPMKEHSVLIENADNIYYTTAIKKDEKSAFYFEQIIPREAVVNIRLKDEN